MKKTATFAQALTDILINMNALTPSVGHSIQKAFSQAGDAEFDDFMLTEGFVDRASLLQALSVYYKMPSFDVRGQFFDSLLLRNFPVDFLRRNAIIPYQEENADMLMVVSADPLQESLESDIRSFTRSDINFLVGLRRDIIDAVEEYYDSSPTEEIAPDIDIHEEHRAEVDAYTQILQETEEAYQKEDVSDSLTSGDDIRK